MRKALLIVAAAILTLTGSAFADVKIKTKQTASGQTSENTTYIKGKRQRTEMANGVMISITQCDLGRDLQLAPQTKSYTVSYYADANGNPTAPVSQGSLPPVTKGGTVNVTTTIKDTGERKQMFGYTARHIIQTIEMESSPDACYPQKNKMEMDMWVIDAEFGSGCTQNNTYRSYNGGKAGGCQDKFVQKTIGTAKSGYPLYQKMTSFDAAGKESFSMVQEVVELSKTTLEAGLFEAPSDYREVKDASQLYAGATGTSQEQPNSSSTIIGNSRRPSALVSTPSSTGLSIESAAEPNIETFGSVGRKTPGTVRVGVIVKTTSAGEGVSTADLSHAIEHSLDEYLKGTKVEIIPMEAKLAAAQVQEAKDMGCDYVLMATVAHKKGGGGFGGFGKMFSTVAPLAGYGSVAGQLAASAVVTAVSLSGSMKSKDELTMDLKLQSTVDNSVAMAKQLKAKAKSDGEDIISQIIEQAAQALIDMVGK
ncbi:MAG: hypothetical protein DMF62_00965 [Acidobacteria bacterium]|nr:MAG: hypothetical protein DMF62_00965 [Acidobacteriota bacterium]